MAISVVMPVHNHVDYLRESIESILNQTFGDFEFFIINDGSTDKSADVIEEFRRLDERVVAINLRTSVGAASARNIAIKRSVRKYIAILDADDVSTPDRLQKQYGFLEKNEDFYLVGGGAIIIDEGGNKIRVFRPLTHWEDVSRRLQHENCIYHPSIMFRNTKEVFYRGKFETVEDYDFYLNLLSLGKKLTNIPDIIIKYRLKPGYEASSRFQRQLILASKAQEFYTQRVTSGVDKYEELDLEKLLGGNQTKGRNR